MRPTDCILPLVGADGEGLPEPIGTGILLEVDDKVFLLSATHVFTDNQETTIYYPAKTGFSMLRGERVGGSRDKEDVCWMLLSGEIVADISSNFKPVPVGMVDMNDVTKKGDLYMLTGFPEELLRIDLEKRKFNHRIHTYTAMPVDKRIYRKCGAKMISHIVIKHSKKKAKRSSGKKVKSTDLHCMSGGAVWKFLGPENSIKGVPAVRLVGVTIEKHDIWGAAVVTRINYVIESIRSEIPSLSGALPTSQTIEIKVTGPSDGTK